MKTTLARVPLIPCVLLLASLASAQKEAAATPDPTALSPALVENFSWRSIGPANMGGRITAISVYENDPTIFFVGTATGGLLKTVNNGITFQNQFDHESTVSIGDVCVAPSDPNIVWVGTGEENPRNSVSYGDGVYKSVDGGKTWKNMGLKESFQIGAVVIHPTDPDIVYVGALGRLYGPNPERGLYKTIDGGETWQKLLFIDDRTGVIEVKMNPDDPDTLLVATYERQRDGFDTNSPAKKIAPGSGLYRTQDGGESFQKVTEGLPTVTLGRIALSYYRKDPSIVYALVESELIGKAGVDVGWAGLGATDAETGAKVNWVKKEGPAAKAGLEDGDIVLAVAGVTVLSNAQLQEQINQHGVDEVVEFEVARDGKSEAIAVTLAKRPKEGANPPRRGRGRFGGFRRGGGDDTPFGASLGGQRANIGDQQGNNGFQHGGVYRSEDGGSSWQRVNSLQNRPMYFSQIRVDPSDVQNIYVCGVSASRSKDGGETFTQDASRGVHSDQHALWIDPDNGRHMIIGSDGGLYVTYDQCGNWDHLNHMALGQFYDVAVGPRRDYWVYGGLQDNGTWGAPHRGDRARGTINADWIRIGGGDGFVVAVDQNDPDLIYSESQNGNTSRTNLVTQEGARLRARPPEGERYRYNWKTPFILSHHNSKIYYNAGNFVFRSLDRGNDLVAISPEITRTDRGSATALAESPINPDVLYVGTDDGALWGTQNGGHDWVDLFVLPSDIGEEAVGENDDARSGGPRVDASEGEGDSLPLGELVPGPRWVSSIEASRVVEGRCYLTLDAHRSDDDDPYVLVSEDFGKTWRSLRANLPRGSTKAVREDRENPDLLYLGTEFGIYASINRGEDWTRLNNNLPTVPVHDIAQHRSSGEIVVATHGRSLWILDVTALRQITADVVAADSHLFEPNTVVQWRRKQSRAVSGARQFIGTNPSNQAEIFYRLSKKARSFSLEIQDASGKTIRKLEAEGKKGMNRVIWDLRPTRPAAAERGSGFSGRGRGRFGRFGRGAPAVGAGTYKVTLTVDGEVLSQSLRIERDPNFPQANSSTAGNLEEFEQDGIDDGRN